MLQVLKAQVQVQVLETNVSVKYNPSTHCSYGPLQLTQESSS